MDDNLNLINDILNRSRADLDRRKAELNDQAEAQKALEAFVARAIRNEESLEQIRQERDALKDEVRALNMKLSELQKVTAKVAEKTEHDDLLKVLRTYMNRSKNKTAKKRGYIKMVITEMAMTAGLALPDDMVETLGAFDDEAEKSINIERINDIHGNDKVEIQR